MGAGRMGSALLRGWLANPGSGCGFVVVDPSACPEKNLGTAAASEVPFYRTTAGLPPDLAADAIILATKPQDVASAAQALGRHAGRDTLLVSVATGVSIASIRTATHPAQPIIRAMPNIGAARARSAELSGV